MIVYFLLGVLASSTGVVRAEDGSGSLGKEFQLLDYALPKRAGGEGGLGKGAGRGGGVEDEGADAFPLEQTASELQPPQQSHDPMMNGTLKSAPGNYGAGSLSGSCGCQSEEATKKPLVLTFQIIINNNSTLALAPDKGSSKGGNKTSCSTLGSQQNSEAWRKMNVEALRKLFDKCQEPTKSAPRSEEPGGGSLPPGAKAIQSEATGGKGPGGGGGGGGGPVVVGGGGRKGAAVVPGEGGAIISYLRNLKTRLEMTSKRSQDEWNKPRAGSSPSDVIYLVKRTLEDAMAPHHRQHHHQWPSHHNLAASNCQGSPSN